MNIPSYRLLSCLCLKTSADFSHVFKRSIKTSARYLNIYKRENQLGHPRLGLVIAKKQVKTAVERNRVKRQIRESFRLNRHTLKAYDFVMVVYHGMARLDNKAMRAFLDQQWQK